MKKSKIQKINENVINLTNLTNPTGFRLKFTNLKKVNFPNKLEETDVYQYKVEDLLYKSGNSSTIYKIVAIRRATISQTILTNLKADIIKRYRYTEEIIKSTEKNLDIYEKNSNFGACQVDIQCILRAGKSVTKSKITSFFEIDPNYCSHFGYKKADLPNIIQNTHSKIRKLEGDLNKIITKKENLIKQKEALLDILKQQKKEIDILSGNYENKVIGKFDSKILR